MRQIRRSDYTPRFELAPMLDVVFVLLTFFIYSVAMMIEADVLPVRLAALTAGGAAAGTSGGDPGAAGKLDALTVDKEGKLYFNRQPVSPEQLDQRLAELVQRMPNPRLYLALEAEGATDRGPLLITLIERVQRAGIRDFVIVGQKPKT